MLEESSRVGSGEVSGCGVSMRAGGWDGVRVDGLDVLAEERSSRSKSVCMMLRWSSPKKVG